jgi:hypothetical protein
MAPPAVLLSVTCHGVSTLFAIISQLNTLPTCAPVNASLAASRLTTHDSGSGWLAMPFLYGRVEDWRGIPKVRPSLLLPFPLECLNIPTVNPIPAPATSHPACGFPALGAPVCFMSRVMRPNGQERLSTVTIDAARSR